MTGFGGAEGQYGDFDWRWEIRSVNGKGLDLRLRLPPGFDRLEAEVRRKCSKALSRGNVQISLNLQTQASASVPQVNAANLSAILDAIGQLEQSDNIEPSTGAQILSIRGVLEQVEPVLTESQHKEFEGLLLSSFEKALSKLVEYRQSEGKSLFTTLSGQVETIEVLRASALADPSRNADQIALRLSEQIARLQEADTDLDKTRLHQEAILLATKADVCEELDRLEAHISAARDYLQEGSPVGRKLEFLAQEFNRETNTLCSKSNAVSMTAIGLELKLVVDQFREQILNVE